MSEPFNWNTATPELRNSMCAKFMPESSVNPIVSWHFMIGKEDRGALLVKSRDEADAWLRMATADNHAWETVTSLPASFRSKASIREDHRHMRYTTTPGGAMDLLSQLVSDGWSVSVFANPECWRVNAKRHDQSFALDADNSTWTHALGIIFLRCHGVVTTEFETLLTK